MGLIEKLKDKARENLKTLILPEAKDERVLRAAEKIAQEGFAKEVILLGAEGRIFEDAEKYGVNLSGVKIIDPGIEDPLYFGAFMVKNGQVDAVVSGSLSFSALVIRAALKTIDRISKERVVSGCFIMDVPDCEYGEGGILAFADASVIPNPNPRQLVDIAVSSAETLKFLTGFEPKVAMLSFSTKGSAKNKMVDKVIEATRIIKENHPEILVDGELQVDAALMPKVAEKKAPGSNVAGRANVLVFPDLNSANIAYKLVERLGKARAYGPFLQGLSKSASDLSRGCSVCDIVDISAIALVRAQGLENR